VILRDYQTFAVDSLFAYFTAGNKGNPIVAMPTGTGKSIVIAAFIAEIFTRYRGQRILVLTHVKELIAQNHAKMLALWEAAPAGIYSSGLDRKDVGTPITFAGIASIAKRTQVLGHIDLILIDECHLVSPKEGTQYQEVIAALKAVNPHLRVIGLTATHYRLGHGPLTEDGGIFTDVAVDMTTFDAYNWFLDAGYLAPLVPRPMRIQLDTGSVSVSRGEYDLKQLQLSVDRTEITLAALKEAMHYGQDRNHWLLFASGVEHATHCCETLQNMGISTAVVHSKMDDSDRDMAISAFLSGEVCCLCNNGILTTGFDFPALDMIIMLRPTMSPGLWVQMLGRGGRPKYADGFDLSTASGRLQAIAASTKRDCLVLDYAGNTRRLGPINDVVRPKKRGEGKGEAPVKTCPACGIYCHASARACPNCGGTFEIKVKFKGRSGTEELIRRKEEPQIVDFPVDHIVYSVHKGSKGISSFQVSYHSGLRVFREWICFEHTGYPLHRAHDWWRMHAPLTGYPTTAADACTRTSELRQPKTITVLLSSHLPEVRGHAFL
jgi:DNA repair protein RadD